MTIEVLSIGDELLLGFTVNGNGATIGQALFARGFSVKRAGVLSDSPSELKGGIEEAMGRSPFVITTGGLGPTGDDCTRGVVADIFGVPLVYNEAVAKDLVERFSPNLPTLKDQAMVPKGATIFHNPIGTAPAWILSNHTSTVIVLPGVPFEMEALLDRVIPYLEAHCKKSGYVKSLYFCQLSEQRVDPLLRTLEREHPGLQITICPSYGALSVFIRDRDQKRLDDVADQITQAFAPYFFSTTSKSIEHTIQEWMIEHGKTLAFAESCTGGRLAARLTAISGASAYFLGGVVSYSNALKESVLSVSPETLASHGAVSEEVVREMGEGILKKTGADYAIAVSGVAGPTGGTDEKPVGTVWGAIATQGEIFTGKFLARGRQRRVIIEYSATFLLSSLWRLLKHGREPFNDV